MKKIEANRYPNSATLFKFCKEALEIRYEGNVKVIDQDVGAILGYDPADCSHWKKGKKNIRALNTLRSIAEHLSVDERLLIDIASGRVDLDEAVFEYKGYGQFALGGRHLETLKKEFFKNPSRYQSQGEARTFEELFDVDRPRITSFVTQIVEVGNFKEAPIYIPEVLNLYKNISLECIDNQEQPYVATTTGEGEARVTKLSYKGSELRPYVRFLAAKDLFKHLVATAQHPTLSKFQNGPAEVTEIRANIFAGMLLVPGTLLRKEVESIDNSRDIVTQLADIFWVSKPLMNQRLRDYMEHLA